MKSRSIACLAAMLLLGPGTASAADSYMQVQSWDPGCEHTVETNNFVLGPGTSVEIQVDLTGCTAAQLGGFLFYGYAPTKTSSDGLSKRHNVRLRVVSDGGLDLVSDDGHVFTQIAAPGRVTLYAENLSLRKGLTVRLVSRSGL
jgi:hypothetical protein